MEKQPLGVSPLPGTDRRPSVHLSGEPPALPAAAAATACRTRQTTHTHTVSTSQCMKREATHTVAFLVNLVTATTRHQYSDTGFFDHLIKISFLEKKKPVVCCHTLHSS